MSVVYAISTAILWICIAVNVYNLLQIRKQRKEYRTAIDAAILASERFAAGAQEYAQMADQLRAEKQVLYSQQENEENIDGHI